MNQVKSIAGGLTVIAAIIATTIFFSFKPSEQARPELQSRRVNTIFRYTGADENKSSLTNASNWLVSDGSTDICDPGTALPCIVEPDMASISTTSQLASYLNSLPGGDDAAATFVDNHTSQRRD